MRFPKGVFQPNVAFDISSLPLTRRGMLRAAAGAAGAFSVATLLEACGGTTASPTTATSGGASTASTGGGTATKSSSAQGSPAATTGGVATTGGTLVLARQTDIKHLDPSREYELTAPIIVQACYEKLVILEPPDIKTIMPALATKQEASADAKTYTFTLNGSAKFSSGNPLTADDVIFSFGRLRELKDNPSWLMDGVADMTATDAHTIKITMKQPTAAFLAMLVSPNFSILDSKVVKAHGGTDQPGADKSDKATDWLDQNSAGSGKFVLTKWTPNTEVDLVRNDKYWGSKTAALDKVVIRHVTDPTTQRQMLESGDADVAHDLTADIVATLQKSDKVKIVVGNTLDTDYFAMNTDPTVGKELQDKRVRQALAYGIDYDGIINDILRGAAVRPPSVIPAGLLGVQGAEQYMYKRDVNKAKSLLADAGHGSGLTITLTYGTGNEPAGVSSEVLANKIASDLKEIGVTVTLKPEEPTVRLADYRAAKLQTTISGWTPDFLDPDGWAIPFGVKGEAAAKRVKYDNPQVTQDFQQAGQITDAAQRAKLYVDGQKLLNEDAPFVCLYQPKAQVGVAKTVQGYVFDPVTQVDLGKLSKTK